MDGGIRLAIGILIFIGAWVMLFFALHPNGVSASVTNPSEALQWLMNEFQTTTQSAIPDTGGGIEPTPSGQPTVSQEQTGTPGNTSSNFLPTSTGQPGINGQFLGQ
jgi:hypothetical protein